MRALYVVSDSETIFLFLNIVQLRQCHSVQFMFLRSASGLSSDVLRGLEWQVGP